jgi:uncharacterized protein (TIGR00369 family)
MVITRPDVLTNMQRVMDPKLLDGETMKDIFEMRLVIEMGKGEILLAIKPEHTNTWEVAHGGVLLTLMDVAMAVAARSGDPSDRSVVTIELKNNFMQAANGVLRVKADTVRHTATMAFCEAKLYNDQGEVCCMATGTFKYIKRLATKDADGARVINEDQRSV